MSKALPFELPLDHQIQRSKLRQPQKVNQRALQALAESQLELHQDLEQQESAELIAVGQAIDPLQNHDHLHSLTQHDASHSLSDEVDRIESLDRVIDAQDESDPYRDLSDYDWFDPC